MKIDSLDKSLLPLYIEHQIRSISPFKADGVAEKLKSFVPAALERLRVCINEVKVWKPDHFDVLHSSQYCIFLYYLSNTIWKNTGDKEVCTLIFLLNKSLNGIDLFYEIEMPEVFFIGHSVGIVLAKANYSNHLILYQNSTVGKNHGIAPVLDEKVILYPNSVIIGRCHVKHNTVVSQGVSIINQDTPGNCLVFSGRGNELHHHEIRHDPFADHFRSV